MTDGVRLARPELGAEELDAVRSVFDSGNLTLGPALEAFERQLARICTTNEAVGCANGTAALHLALLALDIGPGDEVIVPAYTFPATANAVILCGATPVFCDVAEGQDVTDIDQIAPLVSDRTKAIMVVHLFGCPVDMEPIVALASERGIPIVEDAAGALGTMVAGRPAGSIGAMGTFSFHPRKAIITGEGGAVITDDSALARRVRRLRHHGIEDGVFVEVGLNYRLSDILAAIAVPQLQRFEQLIEERCSIAATYDRALASLEGIDSAPATERTGDRHAYQAYVARVHPGLRDQLLTQLRGEQIEVQVGTYCVPGLKAYTDRGFTADHLPNSRAAADNGLALPLYNGLRPEEQQLVIDRLAAAVQAAAAAV